RLTELLPEACEMDRVVEELRGVAPDVYRQGGTVQLVSGRPRARSVVPAGTLVTLAGSTNLLSTRLGDEWYSFVAGELIPSEHPAVVRNPDNFEPAVGTGRRRLRPPESAWSCSRSWRSVVCGSSSSSSGTNSGCAMTGSRS